MLENAAPSAIAKSVRYHALDIWRGIVCLVVVVEHAGIALWQDGSRVRGQSYPVRDIIARMLSWNVGAPLFFVISGYCIAASLDSTRRKGISPARFIARRIWRIFPPYWASMAIIGAVVVLLDWLGASWLHRDASVGLELFAPRSFHLDQWVGNVTLTEEWRSTIFHGNEKKFLNRVAWALCYQEQFYLVSFLALVFFPRRLYAALAWATLAIVLFRVEGFDLGYEQYYLGLFPDLWHEFAIGLLLFWRINVATAAWQKRGVEALFAATAAVGFSRGLVSTQAAALFGLLLLFCHRWDEAVARVGRLDPLRKLGKRSYSVYLIHLPVCSVGNAALAAAGLEDFWTRFAVMIPAVTCGSVVAGWIFYVGVDRHFTNLPIVGRFGRWVKPPQPGVSIPHARV